MFKDLQVATKSLTVLQTTEHTSTIAKSDNKHNPKLFQSKRQKLNE